MISTNEKPIIASYNNDNKIAIGNKNNIYDNNGSNHNDEYNHNKNSKNDNNHKNDNNDNIKNENEDPRKNQHNDLINGSKDKDDTNKNKKNDDINHNNINYNDNVQYDPQFVENKLIECIMEENDTIANIQKQIQHCRMLLPKGQENYMIDELINKYKRKEVFHLIMTAGEMFETVQRSHIYSDSKHFVDMVLKNDVLNVPELFHAVFIKNNQKNNKVLMLNFIQRFFYEPGFELISSLPQDCQLQPVNLLKKNSK